MKTPAAGADDNWLPLNCGLSPERGTVRTSTSRSTCCGVASPSVTRLVVPSAVGVFTTDPSAQGQALGINPDGSANSGWNPAAARSAITFYMTGDGQTDAAGATSLVAGNSPPMTVLPVSVMIGGQPAQVTYSGGAPGFVAGITQVNVIVRKARALARRR